MNRLEKISNKAHLRKAWDSLNRNKHSQGIDEISIEMFKSKLDDYLMEISIKLKKGTYKFAPVKGVALPKPGSQKKRPIRVATVGDRVVQKAIELAIGEELIEKFNVKNKASYAYIKDRGLLKAVGYINNLIAEGYTVAYKGDIENYFGEVNRVKLLDEMIFPALGEDTSLNELIKESLLQEVGNIKYLRKSLGSKQAEQIFPTLPMGIPQGGILSPLFSNIYLKDLDESLINAGFELVRYADDFVVLTKNLEDALAAHEIAKTVTQKLDLELHPLNERNIVKPKKGETKTYIVSSDNFEFIGIWFKNGKLYPIPDSFKKMRAKLKELTRKESLKKYTLGKKLGSIEMLTNSWARTYWFTSLDGEMKSYYNPLNQLLVITVLKVLESHGLVFKSEEASGQKKLKRMGLSKFDSILQKTRDGYLSDIEKQELVRIFNPKHTVK